MATRFYFSASAAPDISPAISGTWVGSTTARRRIMTPYVRDSTAVATFNNGTAGGTSRMCFSCQFISPPMAAQTLSGTLSLEIFTARGQNVATTRNKIICRVLSRDGSTVTGTLLQDPTDQTNGTVPVLTTVTARNVKNAAAFTSTAVNEGDRIVLEIGWYNPNTATGANVVTYHYGCDQASDIPANDTTSTATTTQCSWFEMSQDILWLDKPDLSARSVTFPSVNRSML